MKTVENTENASPPDPAQPTEEPLKPSSETRSNYSDSSKLPDYIKFLCIYDVIAAKIIILIGNLSSTKIDINEIRTDNRTNIDKSVRNVYTPDTVERRTSKIQGYEWMTIENDRKFLITSRFNSSFRRRGLCQ